MTVYERIKEAWKPVKKKAYKLYVKYHGLPHHRSEDNGLRHDTSKAANLLYIDKHIDRATLNSILRLHSKYEKYVYIQNEKLNEVPEEEIDQFIQECDLTLKRLVKAEEKAEKLAKK